MKFDKNRFLACEASSSKSEVANGIKTSVLNEDGIEIIKTVISGSEKQIGRKSGTYLTVCQGELYMGGDFLRDKLSRAIARSVTEILDEFLEKPKRFLFVGLGNRELSSDKIGVGIADALSHMEKDGTSLFIFSPGVLSSGGISACDHVRGLISVMHFDLVIVADSLMTSYPERLLSTVQISSVGITPASGVPSVKNEIKMRELSRKTLGVPVISIGVPTVIPFYGKLYTPHTVDVLIEPISKIIADGISLALFE